MKIGRGFGRIAGFLTVAGLPAISNLSLIYILVRTLPVTGFASWAIIEPLMLIFATVATLGTHFALLFFNAREEFSPQYLLGTAITVTTPCALIAGLATGQVVTRYATDVGPFSLLLPLTADAIGLLITSTLRGRRQMGAWVAFEVIRSFGLVVASAICFVYFPYWLETLDRFLLLRGILTMAAVVVVCGLLRARPHIDPGLMKRLVAYGMPASGASLLGLVINSGDRFLLAAVGGSPAVIASYAAHQRLTGLLGIVTITPLQLWFPVEAIRRDHRADRDFFQGTVVACLSGLGLISLGAFIVGPQIWHFIFETIPFNPWLYGVLGVAIVPRALAITFNIGGLREKKTHHNLWAVGITGVSMLLMGVPLAPLWNGVGAALVRLLSLTVQATAMLTISQRIAPVHYNIARMLPFAASMAFALIVPTEPLTLASLSALGASLAFTVFGIAINWTVLAEVVHPKGKPA